ncbi:MAG: glycosyltransferase [Chitinispirillia bacterium]|nr:glycosyltransferase [Chitinispirillia bacterium]MCL2241091.1 glycosyltransferase [Chitinispirillia bacterium]
MKVCHFITYYLPVTQNWIYSQLVFNDECKSTVLCQRLINPKQFPFDNVHPICQTPGPSSIPKRIAHKIFERYPSNPHLRIINGIKPDILHGHFLLESWRNYHLIKQSKIPLVTTCYGQDITSLPRKPFWKSRAKKVFELSSAFIVEGPHMGDTLAALGCPKEKINVIKLGIDTTKITHNPPMDDNGGNDTVRILFTGLGREKKGAAYAVQAFIKAVSLMPPSGSTNIELHLLGDGPYRKPAEKMLRNAGIMQKAIFHGMKPVDQYLKLLKSIDIVLAPSVRAADGDTEGGAPVVVIEALCAGIPVIASTHCDIPSIVSHGSSGLLSAERDAGALAKDIVTLSINKQLRIDMGKQGSNYARAEHDIIRQVRKITNVYRKAVPLSGKPHS